MSCRRNFTRQELIDGFKVGGILVVDRCDAPELRDLLEMEKEGLITSTLIETDYQSSLLKFKAVK